MAVRQALFDAATGHVIIAWTDSMTMEYRIDQAQQWTGLTDGAVRRLRSEPNEWLAVRVKEE